MQLATLYTALVLGRGLIMMMNDFEIYCTVLSICKKLQ